MTGLYSDTLDPGEQVDFLVGALPTLPGGLQTITVYTDLAADSVRANDSLHLLTDFGRSLGQLQALPDSLILCQPGTVPLTVPNPDPLATYNWYDTFGNLLGSGNSISAGPVLTQEQFELDASYNRPTLMITEVNTNFPWHIEVKNMSQGEIDARNWTVFVKNFNLDLEFEWNLYHFDPGEAKFRDATLGPNTLGGTGLFFDPLALGGKGYVLLINQSCEVVDAVVFGMNQGEVNSERFFVSFPNHCAGSRFDLRNHWSGQGITGSVISNYTIVRTGTVDTDQDNDWSTTATATPGSHSQNTVMPACLSPRDTVVVSVQPAIPPMLADQQVCGGATLDAGPGYAGYMWSTGDTSQTLSLPDTTLAVSVTITDANGCTASDTAQISTLPGPDPGLLPDYQFCDSGSIAVDTALAGLSIRWSTLDSSFSILTQQTGSYTVVVTDTAGCKGRDTTQVTILASPLVNLGTADTTVCAGAMLDAGIFSNSPMYQWSNGDTTRFTQAQIPGVYTVTVRDSNACESTDSMDVQFFAQPTSGFSYAGINPVQFSSATSGAGLAYHWDFGDGDSSGLPNPQHSYATGGQLVVCLTVTDTCGEQSRWCDTLDIATGIEDAELTALHIFPNPTSRYVYVEAEAAQGWEEAQLWDAHGRLLVTHALQRNGAVLRTRIDLQHYTEGLYFIRLKAGDKVLSRRLVKGN